MTSRSSRSGRLLMAVIIILAIGLTAIYLLGTQSYKPIRQTQFASTAERDMVARNLEMKIQRFTESARRSTSTPVALKVTESEVNAFIEASPIMQAKLQSKGLATPHVQLEENRIVANTTATVCGFALPVTISGKIVPSTGGTSSFRIDSCQVGRAYVPSAVKERLIEKMGGIGQMDLPGFISNATIKNGEIILVSRPK